MARLGPHDVSLRHYLVLLIPAYAIACVILCIKSCNFVIVAILHVLYYIVTMLHYHLHVHLEIIEIRIK